MTAAAMRSPKRIFIIGPMSSSETDATGLKLSVHIPNIAAAARKVLEKLEEKHGDSLPGWQVITPPDEAGGIVRPVFSHITHCDFAIADISSQSPNVFYELAMLHANGTPVILIGNPAFYLNQNNCLTPRDFQTASLESVLAGRSFDERETPGHLESLMMQTGRGLSVNPITEHFGGVHMVNVAAATGVATGNFHNFTRYVLKEGGVFSAHPRLTDLVLIRPNRILDVDRCIGVLQEKFGVVKQDEQGNPIYDTEGKEVKELPEIMVRDRSHPRGKYFVKTVNGHLVDYPTPISSLRSSRQFQEMAAYARNTLGDVERDKALAFFEDRLIDIYFETLEDLCTNPANDCDWGKVKVLSVEDVEDKDKDKGAISYLRT